ncbi:MAG: ATP-dependent DNA helicase DinG [Spirochaetaceae bacterium]|jgi:ATP-dependent DNA helicase DinG|nr:ATP-dependent DNA helicase DinG [Spirochaetaceae bacterium]
MNAGKRFTEECARELREAISGAGGNEVFAAAYLNADGRIGRISVNARGNESAVPAIYDLDENGMPDVLIHNHPGGYLVPSDNDLLIAARAAEDGIGSYIVDNDVTQIYVIAEPVRSKKQVKLQADKIISQLEEGGAIAARLPVYENRSPQLELMRLIITAFNEDKLAAAEAGTGVGKSFAYLLPALSFAMLNNERVVISTATITLQQQLFEKDIPLVNSALPKPVKAVIVKGRGNYLCIRRLNDMLNQTQTDLDFNGKEAEFNAIAEWSRTTNTGERSSLSFTPDEELWSRVCSDADACMGMRCHAREDCFVMKLRRTAADARILVVNHHLLFADLAARHEGAGYGGTAVLPPYQRVVIDEAHKIENSATSFFAGEFTCPGLFRHISRLFRQRGTQRSGLIVRLLGRIYSHSNPHSDGADKAKKTEADGEMDWWRQAVEEIYDAAIELNRQALELCGESPFRLLPAQEKLINERLLPPLENIRRLLFRFTEKATLLAESAEENKEEDTARDDLIWELRSALRRLQKICDVCGHFIDYHDHPLEAIWIERRRYSGGKEWAAFNTAPVSIAEQLKEALFEANKTVVCVSATLTVSGAFDYWTSRTGITRALNKDGSLKTVLNGEYSSPFLYERTVLTAIPADAPEPNDRNFQRFVDEAVFRLAEASGGSTLALFTSFESLNSAFHSAAPRLEAAGIRCLRQGDDDRSRLLKTFINDESSVLFAADSFWEGVDAPGGTLRLVILCRLPFKAPNDPVFEARCENLERQGGNPFMELSVPEAVIKFRQGFGRLIRRSSDSGAVVLLDSRALRKRYGSIFLQSIPKTRYCFEGIDTVVKKTGLWVSG